MSDRAELERLRAEARLAELEARAGGQATTPAGGPVQPRQETPKPFERAGGYSAFTAGLAEAGIKGALGIKQLFGGLSEENKAVLRQIEEENKNDPEGFKRGAGEFVANLATTLIPGGAAAKTAKAAGLVKTLAKAGATAAGTEAVLGVGEGDTYEQQMLSKLENAAKAGATGAAASGVLGGAAKAYKGMFSAKAEVGDLIKQGIVPTLAQGADGAVGRFVGGLTSGATNVRNRQEQQIANAILHKATNGAVDLPQATGREIYDAAKHYVGSQYDELFGNKRFQLSPKVAGQVQAEAQKLNNAGQFMGAATKAGQAVQEVMGNTGVTNRNLSNKGLVERYLNPLSKAAYAEADEGVRERIIAARKVIIDQVRNAKLTKAERAKLEDVDVRNFDVSRIREAIRGSEGLDEGITLNRLTAAYSKKSMEGNDTLDTLLAPARRVLGDTPRQDEARTLKQIMGRIAMGAAPLVGGGALVGAGTPAAVLGGGLYGLSALGQTQTGAKALLGQYNSQKALAEFLRKNANLIPSLGAGVGTYATDEDIQ